VRKLRTAMTAHQLKIGNRIAQLLVWISLAGWLAWGGLMDYYYKTLLRIPDTVTGHIYPYNFHGFVIYETHKQFILENALSYSSIGLFCIVFLFGVWKLKWPALKK
jgi:hypothetical protein